MAQFACVSPTQYSTSWPHRELHRSSQRRRSHAFPPLSTAFRRPRGSSTEGSSGAVRMRLPGPVQRFVAP
eukprot:466293-Pyramimonas_sp.AAC.1